ncbi:MAG: hypothetical protein R2867_02805 [Caldilineaceae bacterium]
MKPKQPTLSERCKRAKQTSMEEFLAWLGVRPEKEEKGELWYLSPVRQEKTASFKLTRDRRAWFDHGSGEGGNILDFGMAYFRTDLRGAVEEVERMQGGAASPAPFVVQPALPIQKAKPQEELHILGLQPITSRALILYLQKRGVPLEIAAPYLKEIHYERREKLFCACL